MRNTILSLALALFLPLLATAQGTGFSFQGRLNDGANPANGQYDTQFKLYDAASGGGQIGSTLSRPGTILINGVFSVTLDFGSAAFNNANPTFIEIAVKPFNSPNAYTILGPRQQLTVVPFAVRADRASTADLAGTATLATRAVNASDSDRAAVANNSINLDGVPASGYAKLNVLNTGDLKASGSVAVNGNAFQPITSRGFAKAMLEFNGSNTNTVRQCYNGIANLSSGNCGFTITQPLGTDAGVYRINFGFPIDASFVSATARYESASGNGYNNGGVNYRNFDATSIEFFTYTPNAPTDTRPKTFTVILF